MVPLAKIVSITAIISGLAGCVHVQEYTTVRVDASLE
jgi:hypothetical protein